MAIINPPAWLQQGSYPARTDRLVLNSIVLREGVVSGYEVSQTATPSMSVQIAAGKAFISGTSTALQGVYNVVNDSAFTVNLNASNATFSRYDLIVLTVRDADVAGTQNQALFQVITGTPSSSPQVPSIPASSLVLARVLVSAGATNITNLFVVDTRLFTAAAGGIIWVPNEDARLRLGNPAQTDAYYVHQNDTGALWRNSNNSWARIDTTPTFSYNNILSLYKGNPGSSTILVPGNRVEVDISNLRATGVLLEAGKVYRITSNLVTISPSTADVISVRIKVGGTTIQEHSAPANASATTAGTSITHTATAIYTAPANATVNFTTTVSRTVGSAGTVAVSGENSFFLVEKFS